MELGISFSIVTRLAQSGRRLRSGRLEIARATIPRFRRRGCVANRRAILEEGNGRWERRRRLDHARLQGSRVTDRFGTFGLGADGPH